ncbi:MAG: thiolase family protein [Dehalococcoidia bacterium]|nr:thiolase family protein [Dehalococcoidia bacterium]
MTDDLRELSGRVSIVGVGDTDYSADWRASRANDPEWTGRDSNGLALLAFERALKDGGLTRKDIDGLAFAVGPTPTETMVDVLGIKPAYVEKGWLYSMMRNAVHAIDEGKANTVALVYGYAQKSMGVEYGGTDIQQGTLSYYYYHPWGWSSQAAHWAMTFQYYSKKYGYTEKDLAAVPVQIRKHAMLNENAVMRTPLTVDDYLASRYIVRPLHVFDLCLVNDGGVCLILRKTNQSRDMPHAPVKIAGWGEYHGRKDKWQNMVEQSLQPYLKISGGQAFSMAAMTHRDIQHLQPYDHGSFIVPLQIEGFGFAKPGEGLAFCQDGRIGLGGELPVNTSGGMLSESYMQGWNQMAEAVRQLRHEAGARQVEGIETSMFCFCSSTGADTFIYQRG